MHGPPKLTKTEEHIRTYYFDADDDKYYKRRSPKGLKKLHIFLVVIVLILGYLLLRFSSKQIKKQINKAHPDEKVHSFDVKDFKPHSGIPLIDLKDFKPLEKYEDPEGCPPLKNCDHVICDDAKEDRIIQFTKEKCRECVCVPITKPRGKSV